MDFVEFRKRGHQLVDWMADYLQNIESHPVKPDVQPGSVFKQVDPVMPEDGESFDAIMNDFRNIIMPAVVHWQHPGFMAYFPANSSPPSILAEMLTATLANQCMVWDTSPAAAELEEKMMDWLKDLLGLPRDFAGVIQDTASTATLAALLCAREKMTGWSVNERGFEQNNFRVYASSETHSSIEKAVKIAGFGRKNFVKIDVDHDFRLDPVKLEAQIETDLRAGFQPCCVVATLGTTGVTAIDPVKKLAKICNEHEIWLHVDAAYAGTAMALPEYRWMADGIEQCDSFVFNPHKWMFTNFDCTAYFVKDKNALIRTFEILPEYLKYEVQQPVHDYRDWGIPLGRRFRALKLWFVMRSYGANGIRKLLRKHLQLSEQLAAFVERHSELELVAPRTLNLVCFSCRHLDPKIREIRNKALLSSLNKSGHFYVTHTKVRDQYCIRVVIGQTYVDQTHVTRLMHFIESFLMESQNPS